MSLPKSMGCIVRTAGLQRTKTEIKRDFDYLARLWDEIRETTLKSSAPAMIHSDSDLIKRAIRDIYNRDIEEVVVEGEHGYRAAREFMKLLMPSHARRVKQYADPVPLFQRYGAEDQLSAMYDPVVQLKSGGYLVINPTEALVSIDINSGRSTKEHGIEQTALNTNLEAAREIARQLRLRDMAGLVVIDFIDMEYNSNIRKVEKALKEALKNDRARIQIGRISSFGLMEMSRQRLRTGVLEASTRSCPHCDGTGLVRTASSAGLSALRLIEDEAAKGRGSIISLYASTEAAVYMLNAKRADLAEIEERYGVRVEVLPEGENEGAKMRIASSGPRPTVVPRFEPIALEEDDEDLPEIEEEEEEEAESEADSQSREDGDRRGKKRRRRRGGRNRGRDEQDEREPRDSDESADEGDEGEEGGEPREPSDEGQEDGPRKKRRRRRGGRNRKRNGETRDGEAEGEGQDGDEGSVEGEEASASQATSEAAETEAQAPAEEEAPAKPKRRSRAKKAVEAEPTEAAPVEAAPVATGPVEAAPAEAPAAEEEAPKPKRRSRAKKAEPATDAPAEAAETVAEAAPAEEAPAKPKRTRARKAAAAPVNETPVEQAGSEEAASAPVEAESPAAEAETEDSGAPRRGWWQRTFGE
jgi:ribonuclease E